MAKKKEWIVTGRVTFEGAQCIIQATTEDEALAKANAGEWDELTTGGASMVDWKFDDCEANE
jgi:hypothetical protein